MSLRNSLAGLALVLIFSTLILLNNQRTQKAHQSPVITPTETSQTTSIKQPDQVGTTAPATVQSGLVSGSDESEARTKRSGALWREFHRHPCHSRRI